MRRALARGVFALAWLASLGAWAQDDYDRALRLGIEMQKLYDAGRPREAIALGREQLALIERRFGPTNPLTGTSLHNLAGMLHEAGEFDEAAALFERALEISLREHGPEHPITAEDLADLASVHEERGDYDRAETLAQRALAIREKVLGLSHPATADSLNLVARLQEDRGQSREAEALYRRVLGLHERFGRGADPAMADTLNYLAGLLAATGRSAEAEPLLRRSLAILRKALGNDHPGTAESLANLGVLLWDSGAYPEAEALFLQALPLMEENLGPEHPSTLSTLRYLARRELAAGNLERAEPLLQRVLAGRERRLGLEHPQTADALDDLADLQRQRGEPAQARALLERALAIRERRFGAESRQVAHSLTALLVVAFDEGDLKRAESLAPRAAELMEKTQGPQHPNTAAALRNWALLAWSRGSLDEALRLMRRAADIDDAQADLMLAVGDETRRAAAAAALDHETGIALSLALAARSPAAAAFGAELASRRKGRVLDLMATGVAEGRSGGDPDRPALLQRRRDALAQLARLERAEPAGRTGRASEAARVEARIALAAVETELALRPPPEAGLRPTLAALRSAIPPDSVLLDWIRYLPVGPRAGAGPVQYGAARYAVFVLRRDGEPVAVDLGEAAGIDSAVSDLLAALRSRSPLFAALARELDARLWQPLRGQLRDGERVLLAPDGALHLLPFAVLRDEQGRELITRHELAYLTSARDLLRPAVARAGSDEVLVLAAPDYGAPGPGRGFAALPGTLAEAAALREALADWRPRVLTGAAASKPALLAARAPRILHLATHGYFLPDPDEARERPSYVATGRVELPVLRPSNPLLRAGLALAGANAGDTAGEGLVSALELSGLDLQGTELAVLSACDTGVGAWRSGEGVHGLRRALVLAGVRTSVVSLWTVDDAAAAVLMGDFYRRLARGEGRAAALREAQRALARRAEYAHPYYWAAFVVIGDTGPLGRAPPSKGP